MANKAYESGNITVNWNGIDLSNGWAEDTFLTIEPLTERVTTTFGADGSMTASRMANKGANITLTLQQTAETNQKIAAVSAAQDVIGSDLPISAFGIVDNSGDSAHFVALNAILTEVPTHTFGNAVGEKSWVWTCESYINTDDPSTVTSALESYIKTNL